MLMKSEKKFEITLKLKMLRSEKACTISVMAKFSPRILSFCLFLSILFTKQLIFDGYHQESLSKINMRKVGSQNLQLLINFMRVQLVQLYLHFNVQFMLQNCLMESLS